MVHVPLMLFFPEWRELPSAPYLAQKNLMKSRVSMLLKSRVTWRNSF
jgi:hypothetical protein